MTMMMMTRLHRRINKHLHAFSPIFFPLYTGELCKSSDNQTQTLLAWILRVTSNTLQLGQFPTWRGRQKWCLPKSYDPGKSRSIKTAASSSSQPSIQVKANYQTKWNYDQFSENMTCLVSPCEVELNTSRMQAFTFPCADPKHKDLSVTLPVGPPYLVRAFTS